MVSFSSPTRQTTRGRRRGVLFSDSSGAVLTPSHAVLALDENEDDLMIAEKDGGREEEGRQHNRAGYGIGGH